MSFFLVFLTLIFWFLFYFYYQFLILSHIQIFFLFIFLVLFFVFYTKISLVSILFWKYLFLCFFWNFCFFLLCLYWVTLLNIISYIFTDIIYFITNISYEVFHTVKAGFFLIIINKFQYTKRLSSYIKRFIFVSYIILVFFVFTYLLF